MDNAEVDDTVVSAGPADACDQVRADPYPDGTVFRVWSLFARAISYGAALGVAFAAVVTVIGAVQSGGTWFWALPAIALFSVPYSCTNSVRTPLQDSGWMKAIFQP